MIIRDKINLLRENIMELERDYRCRVYIKDYDTGTFDIKVEACVVKEDNDSTHLCCAYEFDIVKVPDVIAAANKTKEHVVQELRLEKRKPNIYPPFNRYGRYVPPRHAGMRAATMFIDEMHNYRPAKSLPKIKDVIYNGPATIVLWADNTKTVVKAQEGDEIDYEKGLAMAISKKALGNKGNYCEIFKKWKKEEPKVEDTNLEPVTVDKKVIDEVKRFMETK